MTKLSPEEVKFEWGDDKQRSSFFNCAMQSCAVSPILCITEGKRDFIALLRCFEEESGVRSQISGHPIIGNSRKRTNEKPHTKTSSLGYGLSSLDLPKQILKCLTEALLDKPENIKSEDVGGMLVENAKFPEAIRRTKSIGTTCGRKHCASIAKWLPCYERFTLR
ncbi:hypothetical protein Tco_0744916 [Tanacetum coccineum]